MSGYTIVGHCPKCGAPIYAQSIYHSILPPPSIHSCSCMPSNNVRWSDSTTEEK